MTTLPLRVLVVLALVCLSTSVAVAAPADRHSIRSIVRPPFVDTRPTPSVLNTDPAPSPSSSPDDRHLPLHVTPTLVRQREERQLAHAGVSISLPAEPAPAQWFTQRLDHFDRANSGTWQQRYFVNHTLWNGTGPVMFLFGHEREMTADLVSGTWVINWLAEQFGALIVCLEHRFYGASWPTNDTSLAFLKRYLSTEQALEDAAVWTSHIKEQYNVSASSKWIVLGRSYGGTLAALFRLKYPHLVTGAFATSGPLQAEVDYPEYNEVVDIALGEKCSSALRRANDKVTALLSNSTGQAQLAKDFSFCAPLTTPMQHAMLIESWSGDIGGTVQYAVGNDTQNLCDSFLSAGGGDPYKALIELYYPPRSECRPPFNYTQYVERAKEDAADMSWEWQVRGRGSKQLAQNTRPYQLSMFDLLMFRCSAVVVECRRALLMAGTRLPTAPVSPSRDCSPPISLSPSVATCSVSVSVMYTPLSLKPTIGMVALT